MQAQALMRLNPEALERLHNLGGTKLVAKMCTLFEQNVRSRLSEIEQGIQGDNLGQIERGFHSIKSSAGNVGAEELMQLASIGEANVGDLSNKELQQHLTRINNVFNEVLELLQEKQEEFA